MKQSSSSACHLVLARAPHAEQIRAWCIARGIPRVEIVEEEKALAKLEHLPDSIVLFASMFAGAAPWLRRHLVRDGSSRRVHLILLESARDEPAESISDCWLERSAWVTRLLWPDQAELVLCALEAAFLGRLAQGYNQVLARVAHELNAPVSIITGWCDLIERTPEASFENQARQALQTIERNAEVLQRLVRDLVDHCRLDAGKLLLDLEPIDLQDLVVATIAGHQPRAREQGVALRAGQVEAGARVLGDSIRLQQILHNLVTNALKFTPGGGEVVISVRRRQAEVMLRVSDTGQGFDVHELPRIFQRFSQGEVRSTNPGLGLGLAIARELAELHGGRLQGESAGRGRGATFSLVLPTMGI